MNATRRNTAFSRPAAKLVMLMALLLLLATPVLAQNTKGDRPGAPSGQRRESRFKSTFRKKNKASKKQPTYNNRATTRSRSRSNSGRRQDKVGKASGNVLRRQPPKPSNTQRAWQGDITHRRIRGRNSSSASKANVHPQSGRYVTRHPSSRGRTGGGVVSNRSQVARAKASSGPPSSPPRKRKVKPRSASRPFIARKSINVYANFPRPKKRPERAQTTDLAGHPLRRRNYESPRPEVSTPARTYSQKRRVGERPYRGPAAGSYRSATNTRPKAWTGDIAGRRIRGKNFTSKKRTEGTPILYHGRRKKARYGDHRYRGAIPGGGARSATRSRTGTVPVQGRAPGIGARGLGNYQGDLKGRRRAKGGGSVSGGLWNNNGSAIAGRRPRETRPGTFQGNIKGRRPLKGGGSVSGRGWNNNGSAIAGRQPRDMRPGTFQGNIKGRRPLKGGGSVSGRGWNNNGSAIVSRRPRETRYGNFQGNIKGGRPLKGGGSVSGRGWNNNGHAIAGRRPRETRYGNFQGNIKGGRPLKGGGSVSGRLWNNNESAIAGRKPRETRYGNYQGTLKARGPEPKPEAYKINGYPGKMKRFSASPGFGDQGEEFTGYIRHRGLRKPYIRNEKAHEDALLKKRPSVAVDQVYGLQIPVKTRRYVKNKNAAEDATPKLSPTKTTRAVGELQVKVKQYRYVRNGSSAEEALKVREPGKAFARATDYQGNIKMKKYTLFDKRGLHPDAKFVKINKNNVDGERDMLTNFKLWWSRLFKKEETQPDHLKDKGHKPRYDKGEAGLWYD
ncbi:hypothetical protein [Dawidia soli]|uniref:Uncharacterized protein n=1 Tax=Dawidia soli TaxID=2782352 RepID=A0AAP2D594_9BACT|nr:hypothetical protein [Dawidia soli]MBT1685382.1 hypothetical protein [Dawidia soli]